MTRSLKFLGTGSSMGIPVIACSCPVCQSTNPLNRRLRTSALLNWEGKQILIDAGPDFREQALTHGIDRLDGAILTHAHYDHIGGIDELRIYYFLHKKPLPCLLSEATYDELKGRYAHLFLDVDHGKTVAAQLQFDRLKGERGDREFVGVPVRYMTYHQADVPVIGLRFGDLAYLTDIRRYPDSLVDDLNGVKTLVMSALRHEPSALHFSVSEAVQFATRVGAENTWFIHMAHELEHEKVNAELPEGMALAYDGLELEIT